MEGFRLTSDPFLFFQEVFEFLLKKIYKRAK